MSLVLSDICVDEMCSIKEALRRLDGAALRIVLVVDDQQVLKGVVTDGDIRRFLLKDGSMDDLVDKVMSRQFTAAENGTSKEKLIELMEERSILSIPLVEDGRVVGIETLQKLLSPPTKESPVFIMAGGFGTRLRPLTDDCPKPMLKVGDKPILEVLIKSFKKEGFKNFYISTHYLPEVIQDYFGDGESLGVSITYVHESEPLGTGGALSLLPADLPDAPLILINGDILTKIDFSKLLAFHQNESCVATMCVREYEYTVPFGVVKSEGNYITGMVEKPSFVHHVNAGIYVLARDLVKRAVSGERIDMPTLLESAMGRGENVAMFPFHDYWLDIGRLSDFNKAQVDIHSLGLLGD